MRNTSFYSMKKISPEDAIVFEGYHFEYEKLIHDMFCNPQWVIRFGKQKKLRVLTYCMYYQGITARQLLLTNITPEAELDSERVFLGRLAAAKLLHATSYRLPGNEPAVIYLLTPEGAKFCRNKLLQLIRARGLPISEPAVEAIFARFGKLTPVTSVGHFLSVRDMHAYLLSQFSLLPFHYGIECGVYLSGDVMSIADSLQGAMSGARRRQIVFVSDAVLVYPSSTATRKLMKALDVSAAFKPEVSGDNNIVLESTAAPFSANDEDNCFVYIEQDMSTQHLNVISNKIGNYTRTIAMQKRQPATHTLLFSLQTRSSDTLDKPIDTPSKVHATAAPSNMAPRESKGVPATESNDGAVTPLLYYGSLEDVTAAPSVPDTSAHNDSPDMSRFARQECLSSVPAVAYAYYGAEWESTPVSVLADIYESFLGNIGYMERKYANAARTLRLASDEMSGLTIGELFSNMREHTASIGELKEKERELRHRALYLARKNTFKRAIERTDGLKEMFFRGFSVVTSHNRSHEHIVPFILPCISPDMMLHLKSLSNLYVGTDFNETPDYTDYVDSPTGILTLRNCYTWKDGTVIYLENISDDFGGKARLMKYLSDGVWDGPNGYLICLVADDDTSYLKELSRCVFYRELTESQQMMAPLKVTYITYTQFTQARGLSYYRAVRLERSSTSAQAELQGGPIGNSHLHGELVPLLPYGYGK